MLEDRSFTVSPKCRRDAPPICCPRVQGIDSLLASHLGVAGMVFRFGVSPHGGGSGACRWPQQGCQIKSGPVVYGPAQGIMMSA